MQQNFKMNFNEFLSPEDIKRIKEIELILELNEDNALLFLIGVDDKELGEVFKNYFEEKLENSFFYDDFEPKRVFTNLLDRDVKPYYLINLYSKKYRSENQKEIALDFLFNRDYIPEKCLKLILIVENSFLDFLMRKASDFVSFNNFLHHFKSYKLHLKESYSTPKLDKAIAEFKEFRKNNPNAENGIIIQKMGNIVEIAYEYGELNIALEYSNKALSKARKNEYYRGLTLLNLANIYARKHEFKKALEIFKESLNIFIKFNDKKRIGTTLLNIGIIYSLQKNNLDEAKKYYHKGIEIAQEINDKLLIAKSTSSLGRMYLLKDNLNLSLSHFRKSLEIFEELNDKLGILGVYSHIAQIYKKRDYKEALNYYIKALNLSEELEDKNAITTNLVNIADLYTKQNITHLAKTYYNKALTLARGQNYTNLIKEIEDKLKELKEREEKN